MGSFTSMPKIIPAAESDDADVAYPSGKEDLPSFLSRCSAHLASLPPPIERRWRRNVEAATANEGETVRVLQWNVLSQGTQRTTQGQIRRHSRADFCFSAILKLPYSVSQSAADQFPILNYEPLLWLMAHP